MVVRNQTILRGTAIFMAVLCAFSLTARLADAKPEMTDQAISDKIEDELMFDPGVTSTKIDLSTSNGVVTLTGDVTNILAKERAKRIAEAIKGVRAVVNRINVEPTPTRSDAQVQRDVRSALLIDPATDSYEIAATVLNGEVTLTGAVDSYQERELVNTVAKGVRGVTAIDSQIDVDYKIERPDREIKREVEQALRWNTHVDDDAINVSVNDGKVSLSGIVGSASEKRMAEMDAWVAGVTSVNMPKLSVEEWARDDKFRGDKYVIKSSDELRNAVEDALLYDPRVMSFNVDVDVDGSLVTLRGKVDNLKAKRAAEKDAKNTVGVSSAITL